MVEPKISAGFIDPLMAIFPVNERGSHGHGAVAGSEALIAVVTEKRLLAAVGFGGAGIGCVGLRGQLLVPEATFSAECGAWQ